MPTALPGVFLRHDPEGPEVPVLFEVSRSGREYPPDFRSPLSFIELHDNVSMYVEEFYASAPGRGATLLQALFPNTYVDPNRARNDIDPELVDGPMPMGLVPSVTSKRGLGLLKRTSRYGHALQERKLTPEEVVARLESYYEPYHAELSRLMRDLRTRFGFAIQISCHCMSAVGMDTHPDPGVERADFCLGDMDGTTAGPELVAVIADTIKDQGYTVTINDPYTGGELMKRNADPANGVESVMIEINKRLFMDIETFKRTDGFEPTRAAVDRVVSAIVEYAANRAG